MNLDILLTDSIKQTISIEDDYSQIGPLSSSNALLFDGTSFESEDSDHCPRIALLRRVFNIQKKREVSSYLSNTHGRLFEQQIKKVLDINHNIQWVAEEDAAILIENNDGVALLTSRPDLVMRYDNTKFVLEFKTIQSNSTAYQIYIKEKPKLNAAIQLAINLYGHTIEAGYIAYAANNWFGGFAGKTQWKVTPSLKIFNCRLTDGVFYYNDSKSIVSIEKLMNGSHEFLRCKQNNLLPSVPVWVDINGNVAQYDGCSLCPFNAVCDQFNQTHEKDLTQFANECRNIL